MKRPLPNTYWVIEGRLLAGEHPGGATPGETRRRLAALLDAGFDSFIDLTEPYERSGYRELLPSWVDYYNRPLADHDVPTSPAPMQEVLSVLRRALDSGRVVYLHCRAGIGRTGMAIGCHLIEGGLDPAAALARLNELWKQNARASSWPRVPETDAQRAFLLAWKPGPEAAPRAARAASSATVPPMPALAPVAVPAAAGLPERARGMLLGLAIGDALAVPFEATTGGPVPALRFLGGGPEDLPPGAWTDDTAMALCQADSLLACGRVDTRDQAERYLRWLRDGERSATGRAVCIRPVSRKALSFAVARRSAVSGSHDPTRLDKEPLVRCAPPVIFHAADLAEAAEAAADAARVTHQAPLLVDACRLFAGMLHRALHGAGRADILGHWREWDGVLKPEVLEIAGHWTAGPGRAPGPLPRFARNTILEALDQVARAFAGAHDFADGLLPLVARGGDADITGAAYGALAGAWFGEAGLPPSLRAGLYDAEGIARLATDLLPAGADAEPIPAGRGSR